MQHDIILAQKVNKSDQNGALTMERQTIPLVCIRNALHASIWSVFLDYIDTRYIININYICNGTCDTPYEYAVNVNKS